MNGSWTARAEGARREIAGSWRVGAGRSALAACCISLLSALAAGCGGAEGRVPVYPATGKVTIAGEVPVGALVVLYPASSGGDAEIRPSGKVRQDGSFSLTTYDADDGAPAGDYTATIQWNKLVKKGNDFAAGPDVVPRDYTSRETSPWKVQVTAAAQELKPLTIVK